MIPKNVWQQFEVHCIYSMCAVTCDYQGLQFCLEVLGFQGLAQILSHSLGLGMPISLDLQLEMGIILIL